MSNPATYDIILSGVGGQGVLSLATVIAAAAKNAGWHVRQSEVHGMAQRGGSVLAHLRMGRQPVPGDLIPRGRADLILAMEPLEALRYTDYLKSDGALISSSEPFVNIDDYGDVERFLAVLRTVPRSCILPASELGKAAGNARSANLVLVGAASVFMPLSPADLDGAIATIFGRKGQEMVDLNRRALASGVEAARSSRAG